jgi:hypothetical protein
MDIDDGAVRLGHRPFFSPISRMIISFLKRDFQPVPSAKMITGEVMHVSISPADTLGHPPQTRTQP